jgi:hypothetical protein
LRGVIFTIKGFCHAFDLAKPEYSPADCADGFTTTRDWGNPEAGQQTGNRLDERFECLEGRLSLPKLGF